MIQSVNFVSQLLDVVASVITYSLHSCCVCRCARRVRSVVRETKAGILAVYLQALIWTKVLVYVCVFFLFFCCCCQVPKHTDMLQHLSYLILFASQACFCRRFSIVRVAKK